ncbi:MAG: hypothetical protein AAFQ80_23655 [Cyanobacteria bacterium J06621_8]
MNIGRYTLSMLPKVNNQESEFILSFDDSLVNGHSNSEEEGSIILSVLSVLFNTVIKKKGLRINQIDVGVKNKELNRYLSDISGQLEEQDFSEDINNLLCMSPQLVKQFVRASHAYSMAIQSIELDISLTFLLLVTTIECLSTQEEFIPNSKLNKDKKSAERYCKFILQYGVSQRNLCQDEQEKIVQDLKTIYYEHRSGFVHGGKEVSIAAEIADEHNLQGFSHVVNGKDVITPGTKWFIEIVRDSLIGFLKNSPKETDQPKNDILATIARERSILNCRFATETKTEV